MALELSTVTAYGIDFGVDAMEEKAESLGLKVIVPPCNSLALDLDTDDQFAVYQRNFEVFKRHSEDLVAEVFETASKSNHRHIYIKLKRALPMHQRLALQAALGSDPMKELLGNLRTELGEGTPIAMFETPEAYDPALEFLERSVGDKQVLDEDVPF